MQKIYVKITQKFLDELKSLLIIKETPFDFTPEKINSIEYLDTIYINKKVGETA